MQYRTIGKTGMSASVIGLGAEHLDEKPYDLVEEVVAAALDEGINILDVFMPGEEVRRNIGRALAGKRDKVLIQGHICSVDLNQQYDISRDLPTCKKYFENLLRFLGTDYIDFGMLFFMDSQADFDSLEANGILDYARDLKRRGVVRALGASSHNPAIARRVVEECGIDLLMFSINPAFDMMPEAAPIEKMLGDEFTSRVAGIDPARAELYRLCERKGVGITVMKTLGAGKLLSPDHTPFARPLTVAQCIHYALTRPAVTSVMIGCKSRKEVLEATGYIGASEAERDYAPVVGAFKGDFSGNCFYCGHCLPCPAEIDIASVHKYLDIASLDKANIPPSVTQHYRSLARHGSECVACGSCEERCPFGVSIMDNMRRAAELFGA